MSAKPIRVARPIDRQDPTKGWDTIGIKRGKSYACTNWGSGQYKHGRCLGWLNLQAGPDQAKRCSCKCHKNSGPLVPYELAMMDLLDIMNTVKLGFPYDEKQNSSTQSHDNGVPIHQNGHSNGTVIRPGRDYWVGSYDGSQQIPVDWI